MVQSMTAFARAVHEGETKTVTVEMKSVNHRFLDVAPRLSRNLAVLEERVKGMIASRLARGRVDVFVEWTAREGSGTVFVVDEALGLAYQEALFSLCDALRMERNVDVHLIARQEGVIQRRASEPDPEADWALLAPALEKALEGLVAMREKEGAALAEDFRKRLARLTGMLDGIHETAKKQPAAIKEKYAKRIADILGDQVSLDETRIIQEAAFVADKTDITEEIVRARSHIEQFLNLLKADEPPGRSLNFLTQELHREFNTMGSKSGLAELSHQVVEAKAEVEKLREQVQNVE